MYLKSKENKNRINIPMPIGANQKAGVFFSKQQKTKQLEEQNVTLTEKLDITLKKFTQQNQYLKQIKIKNTATQNLFTVLSIENKMLQKQNEKTQKTLAELQNEKQHLKQNEKTLTNKMIDIQKKLFENTKKYEESSNMLQRYHQEIKNEKTLRFAPDSIVNVVSKIEKDLELLKRNIVIHENKLQGKKKYQGLLEKKEQAQIQKEQKASTKVIKSPKKTLNIYEKGSLSHGLISSPRKKNDEAKYKQTQKNNTKLIEQKKQNAKKFNDLTRKKNALMTQGNFKKS